MIYSTGLPPAIIAAAIAALDLIERDPAMRRSRWPKARAFTAAAGLPAAQSPIVPVVIGEAAGGARGLAAAGGRRLSRRRDPPADRAGGHRAAAVHLHAAHPDAEIARLAESSAPRILRKRMTAIFVTATGTDIGKTFVAAG